MPQRKREATYKPSCTEQFTVTFKLEINDATIREHCSALVQNFNQGATDNDPHIENFELKGKTATFNLDAAHLQLDIKSRVRSSMTSGTVLTYQVAEQPA